MHKKFSTVVKVLAIVILIASIVAGITLGNDLAIVTGNEKTEFNYAIMMYTWLAGFMAFVFMYAIPCILEILNTILDKQSGMVMAASEKNNMIEEKVASSVTKASAPERHVFAPSRKDNASIVPIQVDEESIRCIMCGTVQPANHTTCSKCEAQFLKD